jgi:predicted Abi (CAAX) family protease
MKAWIAGTIVAWMIATAGLMAFGWWRFSPIERLMLRPELEAELAMSVPNPPLFGRPLVRFWIAAPWTDPDHHVRWHTLPADVVRQALHSVFPTPVLVLLTRIFCIAMLQAALASAVLWAAIKGACGGSGGAGATPVAPLARNPGGW